MFKNRTLIMGIGIGLIVGALLLQIMIVAKEPGSASAAPGTTEMPQADEMSQQQVKELASRYFNVYDKNEKMYTQAELDAKVQEALKAQPQAPAPQPAAVEKKVSVYISSGLIATQVAELLYRSGVVADRFAFEKMLTDQKITDKIQSGYHEFVGNPDPQAVIGVLTSKQ
ncbi:hypothetical protein ACFFK0_18200 [Paenibacillus chartarius]|uniref:Endolytic transglycosylase MltG n=1 Tax=Paenibacillus chartarius TaxID=747481 RepID=A0ABV6DNZ4_9BACL